MKRAISLLAAGALLCSSLLIAAAQDEPAYSDGASYLPHMYNHYQSGQPSNWTGVCMTDSADYKTDNLVEAQWNGDATLSEHVNYLTVPGVTKGDTTDPNYYAKLYLNGDSQKQFAATGDTKDLGVCFTAPETASYRLELAATANMTGSDGVKLFVYDETFTKTEEQIVTDQAYTLSKVFELEAGEKVYLFFNKNGHTYSDEIVFTTLKMTVLVPDLASAALTPADTAGIPVVKGSTFRQFFNIKAEAGIKALWKAFYVTDMNRIEPLVKDASSDRWVFPEGLKAVGGNQYATIWEGINNAFQPSDANTIGDYFTAPAKGKVTVYAKLQYPTDPGDNPAAADGVGVTLYKNRISDDTVILERTLIDFANSGEKGMELKAENVAVDAGDLLIFVYDNNGTTYSDSTKVLDKYVAYTDAEAEAKVFDCDTTKVRFKDGKFTALKSLTVGELLAAVGASTNMAAALGADGSAIPVASLPAEKVAQIAIYTQAHFYTVGAWPVEVVEAFPAGDGQGDNQDSSQGGKPSPGTGAAAPIGLLLMMAAGAAGLMLTRKKK